MQHFRSNGKLLLTAEYVVLDGAKALAIPTTYGQSLSIKKNTSKQIIWKSYDENNALWFEDKFSLDEITSIDQKHQARNEISVRLLQILNAAQRLNSEFLNSDQGYTIKTEQDFNRHWGLGTSSTLINNIAEWAKIDAYTLLKKTFGGSGYDIACAQNNTAITYQLKNTKGPIVETKNFNPKFKDQLYFVFLNHKKNSRDGISQYKNTTEDVSEIISAINEITEAMLGCKTIDSFNTLIKQHETIISKIMKQQPVKDLLFNDFNGQVKSLGAWGGDFVLATSETNPVAYFKSKGFNTIIPFAKMVKS